MGHTSPMGLIPGGFHFRMFQIASDHGLFPVIRKGLSACAEDHGLCLWMNAQNVAKYFTHRSIAASADFAVGG
jgi:hypothetical protein